MLPIGNTIEGIFRSIKELGWADADGIDLSDDIKTDIYNKLNREMG